MGRVELIGAPVACVIAAARDEALSGEGARLLGGRWNSQGQPAVYCATTASLAMLEWLAHVDPDDAPERLAVLAYELPDDEPVTRYAVAELPDGWQQYPVSTATRQIGANWLERRETVALLVPSAILPFANESNIAVNPEHHAFDRIAPVTQQTVDVDPRLLE